MVSASNSPPRIKPLSGESFIAQPLGIPSDSTTPGYALTALALAGQANVSERLASQSIEILKYIADDPLLYEYFYENKLLLDERPERAKVLCCAEIVANFLEHIVLQRPSLPRASREAWMLCVRDHYNASSVVREFVTHHRDWYADEFSSSSTLVSVPNNREANGGIGAPRRGEHLCAKSQDRISRLVEW